MGIVKNFNALRFKLSIIAIVLITIPMIIVSITYSRTIKEIIKKKYTETAVQSVYETSEKIEFILNDLEEFSTVIISNKELLEMLSNKSDFRQDEFNNVLRNFITSRDDIQAIELDLGKEYYSIGAKKLDKFKPINYKLVNSSGQPFWLPTKSEKIGILSGKFEKFYFTLARKIIDFNTLEDYGYLLIDLEEVILQQTYSSLLDDKSAEVFICDSTGNIISHSDKSRIGKSIKDESYGSLVLADLKGHNYIQYKTNVDKVVIYSTIGNNGWKVIKTISIDYLYKEVNLVQKYLIIGEVIYGVVILIFMIFFSVKYTEPMIKMMSVMKKVEQGDLTARTNVALNDEVGQLGHSLNNMIGKMEILIDKLIKEEQSKKELEMEVLHAQINPHFLYNTLNTIKWMAKIKGESSISKAITALIKLLRISINLGRDMISLREEIEYVKNYLVIQKLRFNNSVNIVYNIEEECLDQTIPKLILQPIVENSIIYGITDEVQELNIQINAFIKDKKLIIEIIDDGTGIEDKILKNIFTEASDKNKFSKVGLNNVNGRIKLYCGEEYGLTIQTEVGVGTKVSAVLPIN